MNGRTNFSSSSKPIRDRGCLHLSTHPWLLPIPSRPSLAMQEGKTHKLLLLLLLLPPRSPLFAHSGWRGSKKNRAEVSTLVGLRKNSPERPPSTQNSTRREWWHWWWEGHEENSWTTGWVSWTAKLYIHARPLLRRMGFSSLNCVSSFFILFIPISFQFAEKWGPCLPSPWIFPFSNHAQVQVESAMSVRQNTDSIARPAWHDIRTFYVQSWLQRPSLSL